MSQDGQRTGEGRREAALPRSAEEREQSAQRRQEAERLVQRPRQSFLDKTLKK